MILTRRKKLMLPLRFKQRGSILLTTFGSQLEVGNSFVPTILGDSWGAEVDITAESDASSSDAGPTSADAETQLWLISSASDIELRVAADWSADSGDTAWYNPAAVDQGTPDTTRSPGTTVFNLNDRSGVTVNLFTARDDAVSTAGLTWTKFGTFTDDDKSTFFNPTNATDYGYILDAEAESAGNGSMSGINAIQFTFIKSGFIDYTITMSIQAAADADDTS